MSVPPAAILGGLLILTSLVISPAEVVVPNIDWVEPVLIWLTISMPTGSRKTTVYKFLRGLLQSIREATRCTGMYVQYIQLIYSVRVKQRPHSCLSQVKQKLDV